jgi:hypothetical protein
MSVKTLISLTLFSSLICANAIADYYRYRDENGQMHVTFELTQAAIERGYDIINNQGIVVETVPPAAHEEDKPQNSSEQHAYDLRLLTTYGSSEELTDANERRVLEDQQTLAYLQSQLTDAVASLRATEDRAGLEERQSGEASESTLAALNQYRRLIDLTQEEIANHESAMTERDAQFEADKARLQELLGEI